MANASTAIERSDDRIVIPENQDELDSITPGLLYVLVGLNAVTVICGTVGNILTMLIVCISKKLQTVPNIFVFHLAVIDSVICGVILPFSMHAFITNDYGGVCKLLGPINVMAMLLSLLSMANIAVNRYVLVCLPPYMYSKIYTKRNIILIFIFCYLYVSLLILPPFFGLGVWTANVKYNSCMFSAYDFNSYLYVNVFLNGLAVTPTVCISVFCYFQILLKFRNSRKRINRNSGTRHQEANISAVESSQQQEPTAIMRYDASTDLKMLRTIISMMVVFIVFMVCWTPLVIAGFADFHGRWPADYFTTAWSFVVLNSCLNIFVYAWLNTNFRMAYKLLLTRKWSKL